MDVNSVNAASYTGKEAYSKYTAASKTNVSNNSKPVNETGVLYESTAKTDKASFLKVQLEANNEAISNRYSQMVRDMLSEQNNAINSYNQTIADIMSGKKSLKEAAEEAAKAISEDGYWGVKQTSERIFNFAQALTGGDVSKMPSMLEAFKKGYDQAAKAFGGELPELCKQTYDEVLKKFEDYMSEN